MLRDLRISNSESPRREKDFAVKEKKRSRNHLIRNRNQNATVQHSTAQAHSRISLLAAAARRKSPFLLLVSKFSRWLVACSSNCTQLSYILVNNRLGFNGGNAFGQNSAERLPLLRVESIAATAQQLLSHIYGTNIIFSINFACLSDSNEQSGAAGQRGAIEALVFCWLHRYCTEEKSEGNPRGAQCSCAALYTDSVKLAQSTGRKNNAVYCTVVNGSVWREGGVSAFHFVRRQNVGCGERGERTSDRW